MNPTLYEGDEIAVKPSPEYEVGDILVFSYKSDELLVHRLLKKEGRFFCKGDNAFRLEDITAEQIFGKVISVNGNPVIPWPDWKIQLSYRVNREFVKCRYDIEKVKKCLYICYIKSFL